MSRQVLITVSVVIIVFGPLSCGATGARPSARALQVTTRACAPGWKAPAAGARTIRVHNGAGEAATISLIGSDQLRVVVDPQLVPARSTVSLRFVMSPGVFTWRCRYGRGSPRTGSLFTVDGQGVNSFDAVDPPTAQELNDAVDLYRASVSTGLDQLAADTDALLHAVEGGAVPRAQAAWLTAHLDYLRLGAAYGTFGEHDRAINGDPQGLPGGRVDPSFTGFHRLEAGLWGGESAAQLLPVATRLDSDVRALQADFPTETTPPTDLALRAHEILENAMQFDLTGQHDDGSNTQLASVEAELDATRLVLGALAPALRAHAPSVLTDATAGLDQLGATLTSLRATDGGWPPLVAISDSQRRVLDGAMGAALEQLSRVPVALEVLGDGD